MPANEHALVDVAAAILDGTAIDWPAAETAATEDERRLLEELRLLWRVAGVHRDLPRSGGQPTGTSDAEDMQFWGRLRLIERVGGGTFGDVYRAWDPRLHREVALKLIPAVTSSDRRSASIIREGRVLARVRHPGVVTIYDAEHIDTRVGLTMEFVEGPTLEQRLQQKGVLTADETVEIGLQLCDALSAAHDAGVLHRDVKASNVVIRNDGRVVLMDFGAGRQVDDAPTTGMTGTPLYLAPEVLQGQEATVRSDVYSLGVLLHHMLTGSYPVEAESVSGLRLAHTRRQDGERGGGRAFHPGIPARLAAVLGRATASRPEHRQEDAAAVAGDLRALQGRRRAHGRSAGLAVAALTVMTAAVGWLVAVRGAHEPVRFAILPFVISAESDNHDLQEGMARDLIARLQTFDNARVISTASAFSVDTLNQPLSEIAARLGVSAVVTGTVVRSGGTVAVEARLLGLPGERTLWSRQYSRPVSELLDLQRSMAMDLADRLNLRRAGGVQGWPTQNLQAHTLYVRGQTALEKFTPDGTRLALQLFTQALELDPDHAQVHAGLAQLYLQMHPAIEHLSGEESVRRAAEAAAKALSLDESLPAAHVAAAGVKSTRGDWAGAERDYQRAIALGPSDVVARQQYAHWLALLGRFDEALDQARVAESLDPLSPGAMLAVASALRFAGRYEEAILQARKALDLDPAHLSAFLNLGHNYQGLGRLDQAIDAFQRMGRPSGNLGHAYALAGRTAEARALIEQFEQRYAKTGLGAGEIAQIYSGLGEIDRAFEWLDRMDRFHARWPTTYKVAPVWDPLRSDPRFTALLKKHGLAD